MRYAVPRMFGAPQPCILCRVGAVREDHAEYAVSFPKDKRVPIKIQVRRAALRRRFDETAPIRLI